ncbi:MAG: hypothetical protein KIT52_11055 [Anaerolineae bacterium]|nr:hypothetical protein [Anaerolineae bacterium]
MTLQIVLTTPMVSALQTALTAHEVYRMTGDAGMIQIADAELGRLAELIRHGYERAADAELRELAEGS